MRFTACSVRRNVEPVFHSSGGFAITRCSMPHNQPHQTGAFPSILVHRCPLPRLLGLERRGTKKGAVGWTPTAPGARSCRIFRLSLHERFRPSGLLEGDGSDGFGPRRPAARSRVEPLMVVPATLDLVLALPAEGALQVIFVYNLFENPRHLLGI